MKRKGSMMGTSTYEFNPQQLDIDVAENKRRFAQKKAEFTIALRQLIESEPDKMPENFSLIIEILREFKEEQRND